MILAFFISFMIHGVIPFLLFYLQITDLKRLKSETLKSFIGALYANKRFNTKFQLAYTLIFILRRLIFLSLGMFILNQNLGGFQICCLQMLNLISLIYIGHARA
jgi:hypothetical protein